MLHFHPSPVVPCPPVKGNVIYPFAQVTYFGLFFTRVFLSDPHPIQQRLLPTCFKYTLNPTTSRILRHWHLSLCCAHMSHRPVTSSFLVSLRLLSSPLPPRKPEQPFENISQARPSLASILRRLPLTQQHAESSPRPPGLQDLSSGHLSALVSHHSCSRCVAPLASLSFLEHIKVSVLAAPFPGLLFP